MRTRGCFGMILNAKDRQDFVFDACNSVIVNIDVRNYNVRGQGCLINRKTVVMSGNLNPFGFQVFYRLVTAAVAKL